MTMISYGQAGEDVRLRRAFPDGEPGFYVDIGANDPRVDSVTKHFYDRGWRGINVEPIPGLLDRLRAERPRDINLGVGLSDRPGELTFFEAVEKPGWSTFSAGLADAHRANGVRFRERPVPIVTLAMLCDEHARGRTIDFLKVDVEGLEREVIAGGDWDRWRPRVVVVEDAWPEDWEPMLLEAGYHPAAADPCNRYYVRDEDRPLAKLLEGPIGPGDDYIPAWYARAYRDAGESVRRSEGFGPMALKVACHVNGLARKFPKLADAFRRASR